MFVAGFRQSYYGTDGIQLFGCGESKNYELGVMNKLSTLPLVSLELNQLPNGTNAEHKYSFVKISCGKKYMIAMTNNGEVYGIGENEHGCLNNDTNVKYLHQLAKIAEHIKDIQSGWSHILMLDDQNRLISRGRNNFGQLGRNH